MSIYLVKGKGWRYEFQKSKLRYTKSGFKSKAEAKRAEAERRKELEQSSQLLIEDSGQATPTDMGFLALVNLRLDFVQTYRSEKHYQECVYLAKKWTSLWGGLACSEITTAMVENYVLERAKVSAQTANKEIRYLRCTFNHGLKKELVSANPTKGIEFLPVDKKLKYVPPSEDIDKVLTAAVGEVHDYLIAVMDTMARIGEINGLTWDDVDFERRTVTLYTRKKKGGHRTPRMVPMTDRLHEQLELRHRKRNKKMPWVFWHRYWSKKEERWLEGPFRYRKKLLAGLCQRAGVRRFGYHALRHAGASTLDRLGVSIATIQKLLGHESRITTEIYLHSMGQSERQAMVLFEQAMTVPVQKSHTKSHTGARREPHLKLVKG